jgi:hypothetical protein
MIEHCPGGQSKANSKSVWFGVALCELHNASSPCLLRINFPTNVSIVSAVELAVRKVKKLSDRQARELLGWLGKQQSNGTAQERRTQASGRKAKARRSMKKLKAWHDSIRFTTDWQPPRMPDEMVKPVRL